VKHRGACDGVTERVGGLSEVMSNLVVYVLCFGRKKVRNDFEETSLM